MRRRALFFSAMLIFSAVSPAYAQGKIVVFAAASLTDALGDIGAAYEKTRHVRIVNSFASSSTLARQIEQGAPAQIYVSADTQWMDYLEKRGLIETDTRISPIGNALVLIAPADAQIAPRAIGRNLDWARLLGGGRLAVGDPDHVPAGIYARQALKNLGAWQILEPHLARGEDVRGALAYVETGQSPLGIVYLTDAKLDSKVKIVGVFPETTHPPIVYPFAIVKGQASPGIRAYFKFLTSPKAMAIFARYGFKAR